MQTIIVILIVLAAAFFLVRRFYNSVRKTNQSTCGCSCDGCTPSQKDNCESIQNQPQ